MPEGTGHFRKVFSGIHPNLYLPETGDLARNRKTGIVARMGDWVRGGTYRFTEPSGKSYSDIKGNWQKYEEN